MVLTLDEQLCLCPKASGATRVLDLGTGTRNMGHRIW